MVQSLVLSGFELTSKVFRSIGIAKSLKTAKYGKMMKKWSFPPQGGMGLRVLKLQYSIGIQNVPNFPQNPFFAVFGTQELQWTQNFTIKSEIT